MSNPLKGLMPHMPKPFQGLMVIYVLIPGLSLHSNPGLKLANAFGVNGGQSLANAFGVNWSKSN